MLPHTVFFTIYNIIYVLPVLFVYFGWFSKGGVTSVFTLDDNVMSEMILFYFVIFVSFYVGSFVFGYKVKVDKSVFGWVKYKPCLLQNIILMIIAVVFVYTKIALRSEGVYDAYAFDSGVMDNKVWTFSMGLSEILTLLFIFYLFTNNKIHALLVFFLISSNLLHGTRIFVLICILALVFYSVFYKCFFSKIQIFFYGFLSFVVVLFSFYVVFVYRSGLNVDFSQIDFNSILSPVVYESIFNQISFVKMLDFLHSNKVPFAPHELIGDSLIFLLPNIFSETKSSLMYTTEFGDLSPLGGLSGYASSIIYFSRFYFLWYFLLGAFCSLLFRFSRKPHFPILSKVLYVYFVCDTLFRFQRDPFFMAIKMLINNFLFLVVFMFVSCFFNLRAKRDF